MVLPFSQALRWTPVAFFLDLNIRWSTARTGKISRRPRNIITVYTILAKTGCDA